MPGLFIQRHAEAVSNFVTTSVLYLQPKPTNDKSKTTDYEFTTTNGVHTLKVFYPNPSHSYLGFGLVKKTFNFFYYSHIGYHKIVANLGKPNLIHVNILTRIGILALLLKLRYAIPYVITEHWSRYLPVTGTYNGLVRKKLTSLIVKHASAVTTVTHNLALAMQAHCLLNKNFYVVHNTVDVKQFTLNPLPIGKPITLIHVSCFEDRSKNISGLLRVIKHISEVRNDFKLLMVGDGQDFEAIKTYASDLNIGRGFIEFTGLLENHELIAAFHRSHFLVMFSNYENMPVVINEALSCGLPIVTTKVGGIAEIVNEKFGLLVEARNENALMEAILKMLDTHTLYNRPEMRKFAVEQFSPESVGKQFYNIYLNAVKTNRQ
jgi:glycosyltransferase involved in cell wall biosynthesis